MDVSVKSSIGLQRIVTVEISAEEVTGKINEVANDIARKVNVPGGYRKFKAKVSRVKQLYRKNITGEVAQDLLSDSLEKALQEETKLKIVGSPRIVDMGEVVSGQPFVYSVSVEIRPTVDNPRFDGFMVPQKDVDVSTEDVDERLEKLQKQHVSYEEFSGPALDDMARVTVNIVPDTDDEELAAELTSDGKVLDFSSDSANPRLREVLLGQSPDAEVKLKAAVSELPVYTERELEEPLDWSIKVTKAEIKVVPELDDTFAESVRGLKSLLALRGEVREEIGKEKAEEARNAVRGALTHQLFDANKFDLPVRTIVEMFEERMKPYEESLEQYRETLGEDFVMNMLKQQRAEQFGSATNETKLFFLLESIAEREGLEPGDEDVDARVAEMAAEDGVEVSFLKAKLGEEKLENLKFEIRADRVFDKVAAAGSIIPLQEYERIMKLRQIRRRLYRRRKLYTLRTICRRRRRRQG
jgi:trigger factor